MSAGMMTRHWNWHHHHHHRHYQPAATTLSRPNPLIHRSCSVFFDYLTVARSCMWERENEIRVIITTNDCQGCLCSCKRFFLLHCWYSSALSVQSVLHLGQQQQQQWQQRQKQSKRLFLAPPRLFHAPPNTFLQHARPQWTNLNTFTHTIQKKTLHISATNSSKRALVENSSVGWPETISSFTSFKVLFRLHYSALTLSVEGLSRSCRLIDWIYNHFFASIQS